MKIAIIANYYKENIIKVTNEVIEILNKGGHEVFVHTALKGVLHGANYLENHDKLHDICEFFIAIGGDGTIIHTAKHAAGKPILGINMGRLGYMAGLECTELDNLISVINGDCIHEERMLIEIKSGEKVLGRALNDGVISGQLSRLLDFEVTIESYVSDDKNRDSSSFHYRADGLILSTPTGSTAYSLSAGGPVVDSSISCMVFTPICPHSLFNRSIVLSPSTRLKVKVFPKYNEDVILTIDGEKPFKINENEEICFTSSDKKVNLIKKQSKNFFELVNKKLLISE